MKPLILAACAALTGCASQQWDAVTTNRACPGAFEAGACLTYAQSLQSRLPFPTAIVAWTVTDGAYSARHAVLAYEVGEESWFIDNVTCRPRWVGSTRDSLEARALQFYAPQNVRIFEARLQPERVR